MQMRQSCTSYKVILAVLELRQGPFVVGWMSIVTAEAASMQALRM